MAGGRGAERRDAQLGQLAWAAARVGCCLVHRLVDLGVEDAERVAYCRLEVGELGDGLEGGVLLLHGHVGGGQQHRAIDARAHGGEPLA